MSLFTAAMMFAARMRKRILERERKRRAAAREKDGEQASPQEDPSRR